MRFCTLSEQIWWKTRIFCIKWCFRTKATFFFVVCLSSCSWYPLLLLTLDCYAVCILLFVWSDLLKLIVFCIKRYVSPSILPLDSIFQAVSSHPVHFILSMYSRSHLNAIQRAFALLSMRFIRHWWCIFSSKHIHPSIFLCCYGERNILLLFCASPAFHGFF